MKKQIPRIYVINKVISKKTRNWMDANWSKMLVSCDESYLLEFMELWTEFQTFV